MGTYRRTIEEVADALGVREGDGPIDWGLVLNGAKKFGFSTIELGPKVYEFATPILLDGRPVAIEGSGPCDRSTSLDRGSALRWVGGRKTSTGTPTLVSPITIRSAGTRLQGFKILGPDLALIDRAAPPQAFSSALLCEARAVLVDLFFQGWRVSGGAVDLRGEGSFGTDASLSFVERVRVDTIFGPGACFRVSGADANVIVFLACSATNYHEGVAYDDGFLGSTCVACHAHPSERCEPKVREATSRGDAAAAEAAALGRDPVVARLRAISEFEVAGGRLAYVNKKSPYVFDGRSGRGVLLGCYGESGTDPSVVAGSSVWLGGFGAVGGGGFVLANGEARGLRARAPTIVGERYAPDAVARVLRVEVEEGASVDPMTGKVTPQVDFAELRYDPRLVVATGAPADPDAYGRLRLLWKNARELWSGAMGRARALPKA